MRSSTDISAILSSQARFRVLRALCAFGGAMSLRSLEAVTGLAIRSVQVAVIGLKSEKVVRIEKKGCSRRYALDPANASMGTLAGIFDLVAMDEIRGRSSGYAKRAAAALKLSEDVHGLIRHARLSR